MKGTILVIVSCILLSFPFLGIFSAWKDWIAFASGTIILVMLGHRRLAMEHDVAEGEQAASSGEESMTDTQSPDSKNNSPDSKNNPSTSKNNSPTSKNSPPTSAAGE